MSGPGDARLDPRDAVLVPGILAAVPSVEAHGWELVRRFGGIAVTPWRAHALAAAAAGCRAVPDWDGAGAAAQAIVHLAKGNAAIQLDLIGAWRVLPAGGRLVVAGANDLGAAGWLRRLAEICGEPLASAGRNRGRAAAFARPAGPPPWSADPLAALFAGGGLDAGSALLIASLDRVPPPAPARVVDVGAGAGHLALAARRRWPECRLRLVDGDARAVAHLRGLGLGEASWWDAGEPIPGGPADLALCNPPCHAGRDYDLDVGQAMIRAAWADLAPGGRLRLVANRQLPIERRLAAWATPHAVAEDARFKVLEIVRG